MKNILEKPLSNKKDFSENLHHVLWLITQTTLAVKEKVELSGKASSTLMSCIHDSIDTRIRALLQFFYGYDNREDTIHVSWFTSLIDWQVSVLQKDPIHPYLDFNHSWKKSSHWKNEYLTISQTVMHLTSKRTKYKKDNIRNHAKCLNEMSYAINQFLEKVDATLLEDEHKEAIEITKSFQLNAHIYISRLDKHIQNILEKYSE